MIIPQKKPIITGFPGKWGCFCYGNAPAGSAGWPPLDTVRNSATFEGQYQRPCIIPEHIHMYSGNYRQETP
jgi:hypothetical protein